MNPYESPQPCPDEKPHYLDWHPVVHFTAIGLFWAGGTCISYGLGMMYTDPVEEWHISLSILAAGLVMVISSLTRTIIENYLPVPSKENSENLTSPVDL